MAEEPGHQPRWKAVGPCTGAAGQPYRALLTPSREYQLADGRAVVLLGNTPMLRLLQHYGWALAAPTEDFSVAFLEISAVGGMPGWPAGSAGRRVLVERRSWFDNQQVAASVPVERTSASALVRSIRPVGAARWLRLGSAGLPKRQT